MHGNANKGLYKIYNVPAEIAARKIWYNIYTTRNTCMQQPFAHNSQTLFEHEVFQLRQHGTQARVMSAMATR